MSPKRKDVRDLVISFLMIVGGGIVGVVPFFTPINNYLGLLLLALGVVRISLMPRVSTYFWTTIGLTVFGGAIFAMAYLFWEVSQSPVEAIVRTTIFAALLVAVIASFVWLLKESEGVSETNKEG